MHIAVAPMNIGTGSHIFAAAEDSASARADVVSVAKLISLPLLSHERSPKQSAKLLFDASCSSFGGI
jgi:hypothetical protein